MSSNSFWRLRTKLSKLEVDPGFSSWSEKLVLQMDHFVSNFCGKSSKSRWKSKVGSQSHLYPSYQSTRYSRIHSYSFHMTLPMDQGSFNTRDPAVPQPTSRNTLNQLPLNMPTRVLWLTANTTYHSAYHRYTILVLVNMASNICLSCFLYLPFETTALRFLLQKLHGMC